MKGYKEIMKRGKTYKVHRLILEAFDLIGHEQARVRDLKHPPQADHINRIRDDNRLVNLRWVTPKENYANSALSMNVKRTD